MSPEDNRKWTLALNFHLANPKKLRGQGKITAETPEHEAWLERAFDNLKKKYDLYWERPTLYIMYGDS